MKLMRIAFIFLDPQPDDLRNDQARFENASIKPILSLKIPDKFGVLVASTVSLDRQLSMDNANKIIVPEKERKEAERAIEIYANILSIGKRVGRKIVSPSLNIAFEPETDKDAQWLIKATGISQDSKHKSRIKFNDLSLENLTKLVSDRLDGASLLAEALSHEHATGKLHELIRVFERAFKLSSSSLIAPLSAFLINSNQGFTKDEVENWILNLRHPATHADMKQAFLLEADVRPNIARMIQAAYDVLLNKSIWRSTSIDRRNGWRYPAFIPPREDHLIIAEEGRSFQIELELYDDFFAYPLHIGLDIRNHLPNNWWVEPHSETKEK